MYKKILLPFLLLAATLLQAQTPDANGIVYVTPNGTGDGHDWSHATGNLQGAINAAGVSKVFVAVGTYSVPLPNSFRLKTGVAVYGGFDPDNSITDLTHNRILPNQGTADGSVLTANNAGRVMDNINCDNTAVLDGFTITGGYATSWSAGIYNHNYASPTLTNLVIKGNNTYPVDAESASFGGGIACILSSSVISNVIIKGNSAKYGAGVYVQSYSHPVITNTLITDNHVSAGGTGGGIAMQNVDVSATLHNVTIAGNTGGVADALAINNTNTMSINNSIVFGSILTVGSGTYTAQHSLIDGNTNTANGNIDATGITVNDIFSNPAGGDYTLQSNAPVINTGNNALFAGLNAATKDLAGNARLISQNIDMGAYEFQSAIAPDNNGIVYVKENATGNGTGTSWANATSDLQGAINGTNVQKVYVAVGNYNAPATCFVMKNDVEIYGGFNPVNNTTNWDTRTLPNKEMGDGSVLNGQNNRRVISNSFISTTVLNHTAVLDGFTIMNGKFTGSGAGIYNYYASPTLRNLVIRNNEAGTAGGGIYNNVSSAINLSNSVIKNNTAQYGGGIYNNSSASLLTNVSLTGNTATLATTGAGGGGIFNENSELELTNVLIANNSTNFQGGGFRNWSGNPVLTNVTLVNNTAGVNYLAIEIAGGTPQIFNSVIYGTTSGTYTPQYSLIEGNTDFTNGNIDAANYSLADIFVNYANGNYNLKSGSPAIDAGSNSLYAGLDANTKDLAGNARLAGTIINLGAFESSDGVLPVTFGRFSAVIKNGQLLVNWTTESETNNDHFLIQVSGDGVNFKTIQTIQSKAKDGNSSEALEYSSAIPLTGLSLGAGFLLLGAMAGHRRRYAFALAAVVCCTLAFSCSKKDLFKSIDSGKLLVRIVQVDKDGTESTFKVIQAVRE